jgi:hypothetical protein
MTQTKMAVKGVGRGGYDIMALRPGQTPSAYDDPWTNTGAALHARWTAGPNWPPTTFDINTTAPQALFVASDSLGGSSSIVRSILQGIPAGDFVIQTVVAVNPRPFNLSHAGLVLTSGLLSGSNIVIAGNYQDGSSSGATQGPKASLQVGTHANIGANISFPAPLSSGPYVTGLNPLVIRLERIGSVYTIEYSPDGISGERFVYTQPFVPTHMGLGFVPYSGNLRSVVQPFRYSSDPTRRWGSYYAAA